MGFGGLLALIFALGVTLMVIACSNVGSVLLARASARQREFATRLAVGATGGRLLRQLLLETVVLFALAAVVALPLTFWAISTIPALLPPLPIPLTAEFHITPATWLFTGGTSLLTSLVFGLGPARQALRVSTASALHGRTSTAARHPIRMRRVLVVAQVTLAVTTVATAGLFVRTLRAASDADIGFRPSDVLIASLAAPAGSSGGPQARAASAATTVAAADAVTSRLSSLPGITAVGVGYTIPLQGGRFSMGRVVLTPVTGPDNPEFEVGGWDVVSPDYFRAVGLPVRSGRGFTGADRQGSTQVAVVNDAFARAAWPGASAIGRQFWYATGRDAELRPLEIVGIVANARHRTIGEQVQPFVYVPFAQFPQASLEVFVRHAPGLEPARDVRTAIAAAAPALPLLSLQSFDAAVALGLVPQRVTAYAAMGAGAIGLLMAALGLHGVTRFVTVQRTREFAIRSALGATRRDIRWLVIGEAATLATVGAIAGVMLAVLIGRAAEQQGLLIGVRAADPATLASVALLMAVIVMLAAAAPAHRAVATSPGDALRTE